VKREKRSKIRPVEKGCIDKGKKCVPMPRGGAVAHGTIQKSSRNIGWGGGGFYQDLQRGDSRPNVVRARRSRNQRRNVRVREGPSEKKGEYAGGKKTSALESLKDFQIFFKRVELEKKKCYFFVFVFFLEIMVGEINDGGWGLGCGEKKNRINHRFGHSRRRGKRPHRGRKGNKRGETGRDRVTERNRRPFK